MYLEKTFERENGSHVRLKVTVMLGSLDATLTWRYHIGVMKSKRGRKLQTITRYMIGNSDTDPIPLNPFENKPAVSMIELYGLQVKLWESFKPSPLTLTFKPVTDAV